MHLQSMGPPTTERRSHVHGALCILNLKAAMFIADFEATRALRSTNSHVERLILEHDASASISQSVPRQPYAQMQLSPLEEMWPFSQLRMCAFFFPCHPFDPARPSFHLCVSQPRRKTRTSFAAVWMSVTLSRGNWSVRSAEQTPPSLPSSRSLLRRSTRASLVVQVLVGIVTLSAFLLPMDDVYSKRDLNVIFAVESVAQLVELIWYIAATWHDANLPTWTRYIDWFISTPVMLVSTSMFFVLRRCEPVEYALASGFVWASVAANFYMLLWGLAMEFHVVALSGLAMGSLGLVASFSLMGVHVDEDDALSVGVFFTMYSVWYLYGVAALLPHEPKNVMYNLLDLVSKNSFGVFLVVYALREPDWFPIRCRS